MFQSCQDDEKGANGKVFATEKYCLRFKRFTLSAFYFFGESRDKSTETGVPKCIANVLTHSYIPWKS